MSRAAAHRSRPRAIRDSLLDYLGTTFALADPDARAALAEFLSTQHTGMFKGPYVRLRLPFRPAADGWRERAGLVRRVPRRTGIRPPRSRGCRSYRPRAGQAPPQPTLVTTGTGSGKTEAFLLPDPRPRAARASARRHRDEGAHPLPDERAGQRPGAAARRS